MYIGEITAPAARDANLFGNFGGMIDDHHPASPFARFDGAHQSCRTGADNENIWGHGEYCLKGERRQSYRIGGEDSIRKDFSISSPATPACAGEAEMYELEITERLNFPLIYAFYTGCFLKPI